MVKPKTRRDVKKKKNLTSVSDKSYYTVEEDKKILKYLNSHQTETKSKISKDLSIRLKRSCESVRDRIKRYIDKLPSKDRTKLLNYKSTEDKKYIYYKKKDNWVHIDSINNKSPKLANRTDIVRTVKIKKIKKNATKKKDKNIAKNKPPKKKLNYNRPFVWIIKHLKSENIRHANENGYALLNAVFDMLQKYHGITFEQIKKFISERKGMFTLNDVFQQLKIKKKAVTKS